MTDDPLPIALLIESRSRELGLRKSALVRRMGYSETGMSKGLKRLAQICRGEFSLAGETLRRLPSALEVPSDVVERAVRDSQQVLDDLREAAARAVFRPHAIILTEKLIPRPIFIAAVTGAPRWKRIELDASRGPETFLDQALAVIRQRMTMFGGTLPMFGMITGLAINYAYDLHVRYDLDGRETGADRSMFRSGDAKWELRPGKPLSSVFKL